MFFCSWGEEGEGCRWGGVFLLVPQVYCPLMGRGGPRPWARAVRRLFCRSFILGWGMGVRGRGGSVC